MQAVPSTQQPVLIASGITKSFAGVRALKGVSFELLKGEVHALVGENGAGKSTLTKIITGALPADAGTLEIAGQVVTRNNPILSSSLGVAAIYQQPAIFPHLTVAENIALALENSSDTWRVDWKARNARARELLGSLGVSIDPERSAGLLSMAEQQLVEIAKAIGARAGILLMDEPTALLSDREVDHLFHLVRRLRDEGVGIIYISHRLEEIRTIADRISVLRDGESIACRKVSEIDRSELIQLMVGRPVTSIFPKRQIQKGEKRIEVHRLHNSDLGLHDISFSVHSGEIFGLAGLVGSGRTELAQTIFGLSPSGCEIYAGGTPAQIHSPADAIRLGIGYLPEDRRQHGVILDMSIASNITMASLGSVSRWGWLDQKKEREIAVEYVERLSVKTPSVFSPAGALSGGNQQKVALARWLAIHPRIMILDEPTQGVDVGSKSEIYDLIMQLAEQGMAVILISSELPEILGMCDRIGVFHRGTIAGILSRDEASQQRIMELAFGHSLHNQSAEGYS